VGLASESVCAFDKGAHEGAGEVLFKGGTVSARSFLGTAETKKEKIIGRGGNFSREGCKRAGGTEGS